MNSRYVLFYGVCLPLRVGIALTPFFIHSSVVWILFGILSIYFFSLWVFRLRMHAPEATGHVTWWAPGRIVHAVTFGLAGGIISPWSPFPAKYKYKLATGILLADVAFGALYRKQIVGGDPKNEYPKDIPPSVIHGPSDETRALSLFS